jgi:ABC-type multidrug transport system fused ATPase/permease subunit
MLDIIKKLNFFLTGKQKPAFFSLILLMAISAFLEIIGIGMIPIFVSVVLDFDLLNNYLTKLNISPLNFIIKINQEDLLIYMSIFVLLLFLFKNLFLMFVHYFQNYFAYKLVTENSSKIYRRYLFSDFSFHASRNSAALIKNITTEVNLSVTFLSSILYLLRELIIFILICYLLLINSPLSFSFISVFFLFVLILFYQLLKKKVSKSGKKYYEARDKLIFTIQQSLGFIKEITLLNKRDMFKDYFKKNLYITEYQNVFLSIINKVPRLTFEFLAVLICLLIVNFFFKNSRNELLPILTLYGISLIRLIPSYAQISSSIMSIRFYKSSFDLICDELRLNESKQINEGNKINKSSLIYELDKKINISNLSFSYDEKKKVLKNVNFSFNTGQAIGIVGSSGSGKTTLGDLIMGLYTPEKGSITLDGLDIKEYPSQWREMLGYVPQEVFILDGSIKTNIAVEYDEKKIDMDRLNKAVKFSNCEEYINELPNKIDTEVGERGIRLSGGQRQRIGIARALYNDPQIILFDEATSSLDTKNEEEIIKSIIGLKKDKTLICISHKLSNLKNMDKIISLKNGSIDKVGNAEEMLLYLKKIQ